MGIHSKLSVLQYKLVAPKGQYNSFGKYRYRNCEDILEAVKPLLHELKCTLQIADELILIGERFYVKATATLTDAETGEQVSTTAYAREEETKKGMDGSQITGASSSYARKYALCGLLCIDDNKDSDTTNVKEETEKKEEPRISADIYTQFMRGKNRFEEYVNKGFIEKKSYDNLLNAEAKAKTDADYRAIISIMSTNLKRAEELEKGAV